VKKKGSPEPSTPPKAAAAPGSGEVVGVQVPVSSSDKKTASSARQRPLQKAPAPRTLSRGERRHLAEQERVDREREEKHRKLVTSVKTAFAYVVTIAMVAGLSWWLISVV